MTDLIDIKVAKEADKKGFGVSTQCTPPAIPSSSNANFFQLPFSFYTDGYRPLMPLSELIAYSVSEPLTINNYENKLYDLLEFAKVVGFKNKKENDNKILTDKFNILSIGGIRGTKLSFSIPETTFRNKSKDRIVTYINNEIDKNSKVCFVINKMYTGLDYEKFKATGKKAPASFSKDNVTSIINIPIECDNESLEKQYELLQALLPYVKACVYSGGRSLHIYLNFTPINPKHNIKQFERVRDNLQYNLKYNNINYDSKVLIDISRKMQLPYCVNPSTGRQAIVIYLNDKASTFDETTQFFIKSKEEQKDKIYTVSLNDVPFQKKIEKQEIVKQVAYANAEPTFFEHIARYNQYIQNGISIGERNAMYATVCMYYYIRYAFKITGCEKDKIYTVSLNDVPFQTLVKNDIDKILLNPNSSYRMTYEQASIDADRYIDCFINKIKSNTIKINKPTTLSYLDSKLIKNKEIQAKLLTLGVKPELAKAISKLVRGVLFDKATRIPAQCLDGRCGIYVRDTTDSKNAIRSYVHPRKIPAVMEELEKHSILVKTSSYIVGVKPNSFYLNIYVVLYLCISLDDSKKLDWTYTKKETVEGENNER